jgi:Cutinase
MKFLVAYSAFSLLAAAMPTALPSERDLADTLLPDAVRCGPVAVLFSRGTFEVGANGLTVGSPFTTALQTVLPSGTVFWGNEYNNDVIGYLTGGSVQGSSQMKNKAQEYVEKCPGIKLVLGGYR